MEPNLWNHYHCYQFALKFGGWLGSSPRTVILNYETYHTESILTPGTPWLCTRSRGDPDGLGILIPGNPLGFKKDVPSLWDRNRYLPTSGTQSWGLQDSFSSGFNCGSQRLLMVMSSDRQRTSRTRKPPWQLLEHCMVTKGGRWVFGRPFAQHTGAADTGKFQISSQAD